MFSLKRIPQSFRPRAIAWFGAAVAIIWTVSTPGHVIASCGDYLHGRADSTISGHFIGRSLPFGDAQQRDSGPAPMAPRCSGPMCQSAPMAPIEHDKADLSQSLSKELCLRRFPALGIDENGAFFDGEISMQIERRAIAPLERPPRIV